MQAVKQRDFEKILKNNGYQKNRTKGDHIIFVNSSTNVHITITAGEINGVIVRRLIKEYNLIIK